MNFLKTIYSLAAAAAVLSCTSESIKSTYAGQESRIETFIQNQLNTVENSYVVSNRGSERIVLVQGDGDGLAEDGTVSFRYAGYVFTSGSLNASNLFATNDEQTAEAAGWSIDIENPYEPVTARLSESGFVEGLKNGLLGVMTGEECIILFSGKYGFGGKALGTIPANAAIAYRIRVESVENEKQ